MRRASAIAGALILAGMTCSANAVTFTETQVWGPLLGQNNAPLFGAPAPFTSTPNFAQGVTGSVTNVTLSPYAFNTDGNAGAAYNVLNSGGGPSTSSATYNFGANVTSFTILWGSPDVYNNLTLYAGANGTGGALNIFDSGAVNKGTDLDGTELSCFSTVCGNTHWVVVNFSSDTPLGSLILRDTTQAAFEFGLNIPPGQTETTPLPAAVWLLGSVLAGGAGFGRWRKRKAKNAAA